VWVVGATPAMPGQLTHAITAPAQPAACPTYYNTVQRGNIPLRQCHQQDTIVILWGGAPITESATQLPWMAPAQSHWACPLVNARQLHTTQ